MNVIFDGPIRLVRSDDVNHDGDDHRRLRGR